MCETTVNHIQHASSIRLVQFERTPAIMEAQIIYVSMLQTKIKMINDQISNLHDIRSAAARHNNLASDRRENACKYCVSSADFPSMFVSERLNGFHR